jgi:exopolyphosphatase/guanosine-5'-triphosphate,3'-diphosphate pyrophosphatase
LRRHDAAFLRRRAITAAALDAAETVARVEIEAIAGAFGPAAMARSLRLVRHGGGACRYSRTERFFGGGITPVGLARLRRRMLDAGHISRLKLNALKGERAPVLAGGFAIGGGGRRNSGSGASTLSAGRCGSVSSTISLDARSTRMRVR